MAIGTNSKLDFLNQVSPNNGLGFIDNYEAELKILNNNIEKEKEKAIKLSELKKNISFSSEINKEKVLSKVNDAFIYYNKNIEDLLQLKTRFEDLYKDTICFITKYDGDYNESIIESELNNIQSRINSFSQDFSRIQDNIFLNDIKMDRMITELNTKGDEVRKSELRNARSIGTETIQQNDFKKYDINDMEDNNILLISEKNKVVVLPYKKEEVIAYYEKYPKDYRSYKDVIKKQFTIPLSSFSRSSSLARFREGYALARDNEAQSFFDALKFGLGLMFKSNLYPAIISACKTEECLTRYIECLENNKLKEFKDFEIKFEVNPLKVNF